MSQLTNVQTLNTATAKRNLDINKSIVLVDIRSKEEYEAGHIEGAINVPFEEIEANISQSVPRKDQMIYLYCRSGARTLLAGDTLLNLGYTSVFDMGAILDWPYKLVKTK